MPKKRNVALSVVDTSPTDSPHLTQNYGSPAVEALKDLYVWVVQNLVLLCPKLSETRIVAAKTMAFLRAWHYLCRAKVSGDYLEFGVYRGSSFRLSLRSAAKFFARNHPLAPRFFAFDSFAGLPPPSHEKDTTVFEAQQFAASQQAFFKGIRRAARGWKVETIPGFFDKSLRPGLAAELGIKSAAFVNIDCDLYEGTWDVLRFVTPLLRTGSILYFDDWYFSGGDMRLGEAGACREWLIENPHISLHDYGNIGVMGKLFIVNRND